MKAIYKGNLHNLYVKNLNVNESLVKGIPYQSAMIKEDILFYQGLFGALISLDFGTRLPDRAEAECYIEYSINQSENPEGKNFQCEYVDYDSIEKFDFVTPKELRKMKRAIKKRK